MSAWKMKVYVIVVFIREKIGAILISVQCKKESTIMEKNWENIVSKRDYICHLNWIQFMPNKKKFNLRKKCFRVLTKVLFVKELFWIKSFKL